MSDFPEMTPEELRQKFNSAPAMSVADAQSEIRSCKADLARAQANHRAAQAQAQAQAQAAQAAHAQAQAAHRDQHRQLAAGQGLLASTTRRLNECEDQLDVRLSELSGMVEVVQSRGFLAGLATGAVIASVLWGLFGSPRR